MDLNLPLVARALGQLLLLLSAILVAMAMFALADDTWSGFRSATDFQALLGAAVAGGLAGALLRVGGRGQSGQIGQREALLLVSLAWIVGAGLGALPFFFWSLLRSDAASAEHPFDGFISCYFEAMSGFTTTGATVVTRLATLPRSLLLWRAVTHWLGGLGIVVLFVAVLPALGVGGRRLYRAEASGPTPEGVRPRISDTARLLWLIYLALTIVQISALAVCGMELFDAVCHTMSSLSGGGFGNYDNSIAAFPSTAVHLIIVIFMVAGSVNFGLYHQVLQGRWRRAWQDAELRVYFGVLAAATVVIWLSLLAGNEAGAEAEYAGRPWTAGRDALFQAAAIQTTTGFYTADFDRWGFLAKALLLALMFIGGSAGSTSGGIKVVRIIIAAKILFAEIERSFRSRVVRPLKVGAVVIDADLRLSTMVYVISVPLVFAAGTSLLMLTESGNGIDITTAATASAATLNNTGPGLARVGATQNYAWFSDAGKLVMCALMALGRLEIFTLLVLFQPRFWRSE